MIGKIKKEILYQAHDEEELINAFANLIGEIYQQQLLERVNKSRQTEEMQKWWAEMLESEPGVVRGNAYAKLRKIRLSPKKTEFEKYYLRGFGFLNENVVRITVSTGFYQNLTAKEAVNIPGSREYLINFKKFTIEQKDHPSFTSL